ncbi:PREDICTED: uncharacterized serine/threonine-protein kinase SgK494 [Tinamus guttatus]|uniref:uncharacterized serine/threonine-protein kinase SgK494 n=1 Tax=Tinamus guttatus TaxID=94827 RepID=UPI00052E9679|nr:PREDICTED: uncharacterized serine/threonine-protein kinase SgK494 [Tinamus guttatus]
MALLPGCSGGRSPPCQGVPRASPLPAVREPPGPGWPQLVSLFLPEFPVRPSARQQQLKILGFVAKGSFGTILKVLDCGREKVCAVKVVPKVEVLRRDTLKQCKEEVSIQVERGQGTTARPRGPPAAALVEGAREDVARRELNELLRSLRPPVCTYCSAGDLHARWQAAGRFAEATVRLFAAELVLVLVYLHDLGIVHRDVKLLCRNPLRRLRYLHHFQGHPFFRGVAFDAELLQKDPVDVDVAPRPDEEPLPEAAGAFEDFDCALAAAPDRPWPG